MPSLNDYSDAELGALLRRAAAGREAEAAEATRSKSGFLAFLKEVGLVLVAEAIAKAAAAAWEGIKSLFLSIFAGEGAC
jgi:hypothetical protein